MGIEIITLENQLMKSNCFIVVDKETRCCLIVDPASEKAEREIDYIETNSLNLEYVIMTHEHADHCWGVNTLRMRYPKMKLIYSEACNQNMKRSIMLFFKMWHDDENYSYNVEPADIQIKKEEEIKWHDSIIRFVLTPGHSLGSMCIDINGSLFTGDTIMPFQPYFNGRGSNKEDWQKSVDMICKRYDSETIIYPGHGEVINLKDWRQNNEYSTIKKY